MNYLKLHFAFDDFNMVYHIFDENYDGAPDAGYQPNGAGKTPGAALEDYMNNHFNAEYTYVIDGKDFITEK